jgi:Fe-S cluster biogenesis protein NfuA
MIPGVFSMVCRPAVADPPAQANPWLLCRGVWVVYTQVMGISMKQAHSPMAAPATAGSSASVAESLRERVQNVIDLIRPAVQADGGDIELVDVMADGLVSIRFHGACVGCPSRNITLQMGIERNLRERVPEVTGVVPVV